MKDQLHSAPQTFVKLGIIFGTKIKQFHPNCLILIQKLKREEEMSKLAMKYFPNGDIPLQVCFNV